MVFNTQSNLRLRQAIPNLFTAGNLFCGMLGLVFLLSEHRIALAAACMGVALLLDVFDGLVARLLGVDGDFGKQLDSLADAVSFGALPAALAWELLLRWETATGNSVGFWRYGTLLIAVFAALRLAKFNIDPGQKTHFIGLPTPAMAAFFGGWGMAVESGASAAWHQPTLVWLASVFMCFLMVSPLPLFSLKRSPGKPPSPGIGIVLGLGLLGAGFLHWWTLPLVVVLYPLISLAVFRPVADTGQGGKNAGRNAHH